MTFGKKGQDPWDRKPETRPPVVREAPEGPSGPEQGPLDVLRAWKERRKANAREWEAAMRLPPEKCPWCGRDMEQGYLIGCRGAYWHPGVPTTKALAKAAWLGASFDASILRVDTEGSFLTSTYRTAWLCRDCGKMVFDMPEDPEFTGVQAEEANTEESREGDS